MSLHFFSNTESTFSDTSSASEGDVVAWLRAVLPFSFLKDEDILVENSVVPFKAVSVLGGRLAPALVWSMVLVDLVMNHHFGEEATSPQLVTSILAHAKINTMTAIAGPARHSNTILGLSCAIYPLLLTLKWGIYVLVCTEVGQHQAREGVGPYN